MKTKTIYYFGSVLLFVVLFYDLFVGINLSILTQLLLIGSYYLMAKKGITRSYLYAFWGGIISSFSFALYGDGFSFFVIFVSLNWVAMLMFDPHQKLFKLFLLAPLNYIMSLPNIAESKTEVSTNRTAELFKKLMAYAIIPLIITFVFAMVYVASSDLASDYISKLTFDIDIKLPSLLWVTFLGIFLMYFFWFFKLPSDWGVVKMVLSENYRSNEFNPTPNVDIIRKSAEITFVMLNIILLIFIAIYGIENLSQNEGIDSVSANLHVRVYAVILSIIMAISLILFLFRSQFSFDTRSKNLKRLTFAWISLNSVLVLIAFAKNMEYINMLGLTEKRIGVFIFLILCWVGLYLTFKKISINKTNWYLIHRMMTTIYFTFIFISIFNWGWIITKFNIASDIPIEQDVSYYMYNLSGNETVLYDYFYETNNFDDLESLKLKLNQQKYTLQLDGALQPVYAKYKITQEMK